jgi:hypothetical protein
VQAGVPGVHDYGWLLGVASGVAHEDDQPTANTYVGLQDTFRMSC